MLTWDNQFDWTSFWVIMYLGLSQVIAYAAVILPFKFARLSGLNIGIIEAQWSISPFFVALCEWVISRVGIKLYQIIGMLLLATMAILISLSDLFFLDETDLVIAVDPQ